MIPSPKVDYDELDPFTSSVARMVIENEIVPGMKSKLYHYQKESVLRMLQKENHPGSAIDPLYVPLCNLLDGEKFYFQPTNMEVICDPPLMAQPYGGILSEELGSGKTCMLLGKYEHIQVILILNDCPALILLTQHQLPAPEESLLEPRPVLTPVFLRHSRTLEALEARESAYGSCDAVDFVSSFPTLSGLVSHQIRSHLDTSFFHLKEEFMNSFSFWPEVKKNVPFYFQSSKSDIQISKQERLSRYPVLSPPKRIYLSAATLVIVPPHLFIQWQSEIHKHCHDNVLRILTIDGNGRIPNVKRLANDFDLIILSTTRKNQYS